MKLHWYDEKETGLSMAKMAGLIEDFTAGNPIYQITDKYRVRRLDVYRLVNKYYNGNYNSEPLLTLTIRGKVRL